MAGGGSAAWSGELLVEGGGGFGGFAVEVGEVGGEFVVGVAEGGVVAGLVFDSEAGAVEDFVAG